MSNNDNTVNGYAVVYNCPSKPLYLKGRSCVEIIRPGALRECLKSGTDIKALVGHDTTLVCGSTRSGTLKLSEDAVGVAFELKLDRNISYANDIYLAVQRGDVRGCSFYCGVPKGGDKWQQWNGGNWLRTITQLETNEISIVAFPAYADTAVEVSKGYRSTDIWDNDYKMSLALGEMLTKEVGRTIPLSVAKAMVRLAELGA